MSVGKHATSAVARVLGLSRSNLLAKERLRRGLPPLSHKRVCRVMKSRATLLERHTGKQARMHDGKVITLKSDLRWCSDAFEILCWNGERGQVAFALDCSDREAIGFVATSGATAYKTRAFGTALGFVVCNTQSYSPESNDTTEAFVKTFKRDYFYLNELRSAVHVLP